MRKHSVINGSMAELIDGSNLGLDEEVILSIFDKKYSMVTYDAKGEIERGAHNNVVNDSNLDESERNIAYGTKIGDKEQLTIDTNGKVATKLIEEELITENINLLKGFTVILGALGVKKSFLSAHLDDRKRGDGHYVRLPFQIDGQHLWSNWITVVNSAAKGDESAKTLNTFSNYASFINLLSEGSRSSSSLDQQIAAALPWKSSTENFVNSIEPREVDEISNFVFKGEVGKTPDVNSAAKKEYQNYGDNMKSDIFSLLFISELEERVRSKGALNFAEGQEPFSLIDVFIRVNGIVSADSKELQNEEHLPLSVLNMLYLFQLSTNDNLNIQVNSEKPEYEFSPNTVVVKMIINLGKVEDGFFTLKIRFRGLEYFVDANITRFIYASSFFGKLTISSLNPSMISNGLKSSLTKRAFDLTFLKQLIGLDMLLADDNRRVIAEIRDDHAEAGEVTELFLAACSTVIGLKMQDEEEETSFNFSAEKKRDGVRVILNKGYIRFKYLKNKSIDVAKVDEDNIAHLDKIVACLAIYTDANN